MATEQTQKVAERYIFKKFHSQPLVLPVVIEV